MSVPLCVQTFQEALSVAQYDVVVVGAGPYGLSAAAHLVAQGVKVGVFGKPLHFWHTHMPQGMLLRSYWWATNLSDPEGKYSFAAYFRAVSQEATNPLPRDTFVKYGLWFQKHAVPDVDETYIVSIERRDDLFILSLADERVVISKSVVLAPGLQYYAYYPPEFRHLPFSLLSHSVDHHALNSFADKRVAVIGRGQAALETAALLHENNASVHVISRHPITWIPQANTQIPTLLRELRAPRAGMGCGWLNLLLEKYPYSFYRLPERIREYVLTTRHGPAGSHWLRPRIMDRVTLHEHAQIENMTTINNHVKMQLSTGNTVEVDHIVLGTGYRTDITRLPMLHPELLDQIEMVQGVPTFNSRFECSVPGLFFIGYTTARSFGPFYRFVIGDEAAARRVTHAVTRFLLQFC